MVEKRCGKIENNPRFVQPLCIAGSAETWHF